LLQRRNVDCLERTCELELAQAGWDVAIALAELHEAFEAHAVHVACAKHRPLVLHKFSMARVHRRCRAPNATVPTRSLTFLQVALDDGGFVLTAPVALLVPLRQAR
jgi:hypothetical protein